MPKAKTKKSVKKRVKITGTGKLMVRRAFKSHLLSKKTKRRKRNLSKSHILEGGEKRNLKKLLPYSS